MNRRSFFSRILPGAVGAAAMAPAVVEAVSAELPDVIVANGIEAKWLGWKEFPWADAHYGVWIFRLPDGRRSYSTSTGMVVRNHVQGAQFNLTTRGDNWLTSENDSPLRRQMLRTESYERGIADAKAWMAEPKIHEPEYTVGFTGFKPPR